MSNIFIYLLGALSLVILIWIIFRLVRGSNRKEAIRVAREHRMRIIAVYTYGYQFALNDFNYLMKLVERYNIKPEEIGANSYRNLAQVASNSFWKHLEFVTQTGQELYSDDQLQSMRLEVVRLRAAWEL